MIGAVEARMPITMLKYVNGKRSAIERAELRLQSLTSQHKFQTVLRPQWNYSQSTSHHSTRKGFPALHALFCTKGKGGCHVPPQGPVTQPVPQCPRGLGMKTGWDREIK